jgi:hypothetical protein
MRQKSWSSQDAEFLPAHAHGDAPASSGQDSGTLDALLQAAMAVAGGEGSGDGSCSVGMPPWFTRLA